MKNTDSQYSARTARACCAAVVIGMGLFVTGCASITHLEYGPFVRDLGGKNELEISTYPAWFGRDTLHIPFLYRKMETHRKVYFQVFVRDIVRKVGKNAHVESIRIHSFTYRIGNQPKTELLSDYDQNFWMQGNSNYDKLDLPPVPYDPDAVLAIEIAFTLNGNDYSFKGEMHPSKRTTHAPLILYMMG